MWSNILYFKWSNIFFLVFLLKNMMHLSFIHIHVEARINSIKFRKLYQKKINVLITCKTKSYR